MNSFFSKLIPTILMTLTTSSAWGAPAQVLLIRHGEKPDSGPDLNADGYKRAQLLVDYFKTTPAVTQYGTPVAIYAMTPAADGSDEMRPFETVTPLAQALGLKIQTQFAKDQTQPLAQEILSNPAYDGKMVLICWEHKAILDIVQAFGVSPLPAKWPGSDFGSVWEIDFSGNQVAGFKQFSEHLMPDDN